MTILAELAEPLVGAIVGLVVLLGCAIAFVFAPRWHR